MKLFSALFVAAFVFVGCASKESKEVTQMDAPVASESSYEPSGNNWQLSDEAEQKQQKTSNKSNKKSKTNRKKKS